MHPQVHQGPALQRLYLPPSALLVGPVRLQALARLVQSVLHDRQFQPSAMLQARAQQTQLMALFILRIRGASGRKPSAQKLSPVRNFREDLLASYRRRLVHLALARRQQFLDHSPVSVLQTHLALARLLALLSRYGRWQQLEVRQASVRLQQAAFRVGPLRCRNVQS